MSRVLLHMTAPISRLNYTDVEILQPIHVDLTTGLVEVIGRFVDSGGNATDNGASRTIQLTAAQVNTFLTALINQGQAQGQIPAGTVSVV